MDFLLGLLTAVVLFLLLFIAYTIGRKQVKKPIKTNHIDDAERLELERYNKHFRELMTYDVDKALQPKKVR